MTQQANHKNTIQDTPLPAEVDNAPRQDELYTVAIGASAGGLEAINAFFEKVPADSGLCFVLIQHLSPDYKSMMPELLSKHTVLPIHKISDGDQLQANVIYAIPADHNITIKDGVFQLERRNDTKSLNLPINLFMKSLAEDQGGRAIGVVLSGTGSDATLGFEALKQHGGMVIAQDPVSAAFDGMPRSAIATGLVDFILHPSRMADTIINYIRKSAVELPDLAPHSEEDEIHTILSLILQRTGMDFHQYKKTTIVRRVERRMNLQNIRSRESYIQYLRNDPYEIDLLSADMLINVTSFFRDANAYEVLNEKVIEPLVRDHEGARELRFWIAGCSTGQEAYSVTMLLLEAIRKYGKKVPLKIFATDVDQRALDVASKGEYPESIESEIPAALLVRYFQKQEHHFQVNKELRERIIFAKHDLTKDPPFNSIHLISCRNMLIYIEPDAQEKILSFIHFALVEKGFLFLGPSENLGNYNRVFDEVSGKHKLYQNTSSAQTINLPKLRPFEHRRIHPAVAKPSHALTSFAEPRILDNFKDMLLEDMVSPTAIIDEQNNVVHLAGEAERFIKLPKKQLSLNILKMVDEQLYVAVSNVISKTRINKGKITSPLLEYEVEAGQKTLVSVVGKSYTEPLSRTRYSILSFIEAPLMERSDEVVNNTQFNLEQTAHILRLEEDLKETKEFLQAANEELETSNEELQATNEELMAANEELQSSNEELQSVNEELYTVNNEYQEKLLEMTDLNDDLNNFIQSTHIPTLFLDLNYNIRRFTDEIRPLIKVTPSDEGRYVGDFTHLFQQLNLIQVAEQVIDNFHSVEQEVTTTQGDVYQMRAMPYKTSKKEVRGVVFTFIELTRQKKTERDLLHKAQELERSNHDLEQFAYVASHDLKAPISNLMGLINLIKAQDGIQENSADLFKKLESSVMRMNTTIRTLNEVITLKKNLDLPPEKLVVQKVLNDVIDLIQDQVTQSQAQIETDFSACETLYFPEVHLRSILQNTITNAIKYRQPNRTLHILIRTAIEGDTVCLSVVDNGRGIDLQSYGNKLFGLFQRFHLDTPGKGIGLHIIKSIVEKYGGRIEVDSQLQKGTTFRIYLKKGNSVKSASAAAASE
ncbi:two-component system, chemotaxis family, CheB/CheR fusion protein [Catalinimonas alkaloidigena]|uniref:Two-component system, chemotaxis family, CheB/CheR fusion protein n=2 Tax=Catalinimonas alkaloidigena TaxID=1075417 RepID=A0A1G9RKL7_9BACT|nr:two-component system, chemotaxis family, CheB/CheR fusion protein [Catalinimonas alkaloidigena]